MSEVVGTLIPFQTEAKALIRAQTTDFVNRLPSRVNRTAIDFDFTPKGPAFTYVAGPNAYTLSNAWRVGKNKAMTFTASVQTTPGVSVLEYRWDFGDGVILYGNPVQHAFNIFGTRQVVLTVTDSHNRKTFRRKQVYPSQGMIPSITTLAADSITSTSARLQSRLNTYDLPITSHYYEWGVTTAYGSTGTLRSSVNAWQDTTNNGHTQTSLTPNTLYHFRVNANYANGVLHGGDLTFTTLP